MDDVEKLYQLRARPLEYLSKGAPGFAPLSKDVEERLDALTKIADMLGIDDVSFLSVSSALSRLSSEELDLRQSLLKLEHVEHELEAHLEWVRHEKCLIDEWTEKLRSVHGSGEEEVAALNRKREVLLRKSKEYQDELNEILEKSPAEGDTVTVTELLALQDDIRKREQDIKTKRVKIKAFQGLPPNLELARMELRHARDEQTKLIRLREELLGKMADSLV